VRCLEELFNYALMDSQSSSRDRKPKADLEQGQMQRHVLIVRLGAKFVLMLTRFKRCRLLMAYLVQEVYVPCYRVNSFSTDAIIGHVSNGSVGEVFS
jgi:hypothetical protein